MPAVCAFMLEHRRTCIEQRAVNSYTGTWQKSSLGQCNSRHEKGPLGTTDAQFCYVFDCILRLQRNTEYSLRLQLACFIFAPSRLTLHESAWDTSSRPLQLDHFIGTIVFVVGLQVLALLENSMLTRLAWLILIRVNVALLLWMFGLL